LVGFLALVLVAGMTSPAFAAPATSVTSGGELDLTDVEAIFRAQLNELNIIFDNGMADFALQCGTDADTRCADDFVLDVDSVVTDIHFDAFDITGPNNIPAIEYYFYEDDAGFPGDLIQTGEGVNIHKEAIDEFNFRYWLDLDVPLPLDAGTTYWMALGSDLDFNTVDWWTTSPVSGNQVRFTNDDGVSWQTNLNFDMNFALTGDQNRPIGGTSFPVSTTALLVAGAQANMGLLSLALVGMVAAGAAITYKLKSKKTEK